MGPRAASRPAPLPAHPPETRGPGPIPAGAPRAGVGPVGVFPRARWGLPPAAREAATGRGVVNPPPHRRPGRWGDIEVEALVAVPLEGADERPEPCRVDELEIAQIHRHVRTLLAEQRDHPLAKLGHAVEVDVASHPEHAFAPVGPFFRHLERHAVGAARRIRLRHGYPPPLPYGKRRPYSALT